MKNAASRQSRRLLSLPILRLPITSLGKPIGNWQLPIRNVSAAVCSADFVQLRIASRAISRL